MINRMDYDGEWPPEQNDVDVSKMKVTISTCVEWPNGETHKFQTEIPLMMVLGKHETGENILAEEWLKLMNFAGNDSGVLDSNEHLSLVRRKDDTSEN